MEVLTIPTNPFPQIGMTLFGYGDGGGNELPG